MRTLRIKKKGYLDDHRKDSDRICMTFEDKGFYVSLLDAYTAWQNYSDDHAKRPHGLKTWVDLPKDDGELFRILMDYFEVI